MNMQFTVTVKVKDERSAALVRDEVAHFCEDLREANKWYIVVSYVQAAPKPKEQDPTDIIRAMVAEIKAGGCADWRLRQIEVECERIDEEKGEKW